MRTPNRKCKVCGKPTYVKPYAVAKNKNSYCSMICLRLDKKSKPITCPICKKEFYKRNKTQTTCSRTCANKQRAGIKYKTKPYFNNQSETKLQLLKDTFHIEHCMIEDCTYNKVYNIHRFISGKDGGKYEIGNMFAICPNHHAEIHKKLITVKKISDSLLCII